MKKGVRIGLGILLALILVFGAGNLLYAYIQTGENAQASQEARDLVDIPEPDPPMAELPGYSNASQQSDPVWVPAEEQSMQQTGDPGFDDPAARNLLDIGLEKLQRENPDVVAWIVIPDTPISYPVLQGTDNAFYLKHNWKKERNSGGSIFMECKNNPDFTDFNTLVYGHRMRDSSMFNALRHFGLI